MYFDLLTQGAIVANEKEKLAALAASKEEQNAKTPTPSNTTTAPASSDSSTKSSGATTPAEGATTPVETITEDRRAHEDKLAGYLWSIR